MDWKKGERKASRIRITPCGRVEGTAIVARPVAHDFVSGSTVAADTTLSWSHTCTGEHRLLIVDLTWFESVLSISGINIASVTFNGVALTRKDSQVGVANAEIWYLVAPTAGTFAVVVTVGGPGVAEGGKASINAGSFSFREVDQASPLGSVSTSVAINAAPSVGLVGVSANNLCHDFLTCSHPPSFATRTVGPLPQVMVRNVQTGSTAADRFSNTSSFENSVVGAVTMSYTLSGSRSHILSAVEIHAG